MMSICPKHPLLVSPLLSLVLTLSAGMSASAETISVGPNDDWFGVLTGRQLQPGDEVVLAAGTYSDPRRLVLSHRGTAERPIVIRAAKDADVIFQRLDARQNSIEIHGAAYLQLRDLEITGGSAGIRIYGREDQTTTGITLHGLHIHHTGGVAVTCNHTGNEYSRMLFQFNHIHHTGGHAEGFYLGGNDGTASFHDSQITDNYIHDLRGPGVSQGDGIEIKQGSYGNLIARNVIHDTHYPGITVYGTAGKADNRIEANLIWNSDDHGIQAAADAVIVDNWVRNAAPALYSRNHQQAVVGSLTIRDNVLIAQAGSPALRIIHPRHSSGENQLSGPVQISGNLLISETSQTAARLFADPQLTFSDNYGQGAVEGIPTALTPAPSAAELPRWVETNDAHPVWQHLSRDQIRNQFQSALAAP